MICELIVCHRGRFHVPHKTPNIVISGAKCGSTNGPASPAHRPSWLREPDRTLKRSVTYDWLVGWVSSWAHMFAENKTAPYRHTRAIPYNNGCGELGWQNLQTRRRIPERRQNEDDDRGRGSHRIDLVNESVRLKCDCMWVYQINYERLVEPNNITGRLGTRFVAEVENRAFAQIIQRELERLLQFAS